MLSIEITRFEPASALFPGGEPPGAGDAMLADLIQGAAALPSGATLLVEIGRGQLAAVERHAAPSPLHVVAVIDDYAGIARVVRLIRS